MSLIMRQARVHGAQSGYRQAGKVSPTVAREYAGLERFYDAGMGDPFFGGILGTVLKVGGSLVKKLIPGLGAATVADAAFERPPPAGPFQSQPWDAGTMYGPSGPSGPRLVDPQQDPRYQIPGEEWARRLPGGKTGMYPPEQIQMWKARAGRPSGQTGHHWNKSGYYRNTPDGAVYIWPGMISVRNRRRNPANARATRRAIGRIDGAKRMAKDLSRITIRKKC
jgi:hypothetical protein